MLMQKFLLIPLYFFCLSGLFAQCQPALEDHIFNQIFAGVSPMTQGRDATIRDVTMNNCLHKGQVARFAQLYPNDTERYNYLIFARSYVSDFENYHELNYLMSDPELQNRFTGEVLQQPIHNNPIIEPPAPIHTNPPIVEQPIYHQPTPAPLTVYVPGYTGRLGCPMPIDDATANAWVGELKRISFDSEREQTARRLISGQCLTVAQIRRMSNTFSFDSGKLNFMKSALAQTYDIDNFLLLNEAFSFSSSKRDLGDFFTKNSNKNVWMRDYATQGAATQGAGGQRGCAAPMSDTEFETVFRVAKAQNFDTNRTNDIRNAVGERCMSVAQIRRLGQLFSFDSNKLDFLQYARPRTFDVQNFGQLEDLFSFDSSKRKLREMR